MADETLCEKLLRLDGASIDDELTRLRCIAESQIQSARRIGRWTRGVWIAAGAVLVLLIALTLTAPAFQMQASTVPGSTTQQVATESGGRGLAIGIAVAIPILGLLIACGLFLLVTLVFTRRRATLAQIRNSIVSIETQLKVLAMEHEKSSAGTRKTN